MKIFSVILLSILVLTVNVHAGLHLLVYELGKPLLIEKYCVNKSFNQDCEAVCHISKVIQEASDIQKSDNIPTPEVELKQISFIKNQVDLISFNLTVFSFLFHTYIENKGTNPSNSLFHPPNNLG